MTMPNSDRSARVAIAVMAKASSPGRTKTRLIPALGAEGAAAMNTAFLQDIVANLDVARNYAPIDPWMAFAPSGSEAFFQQHLPSDVGLLETVAPHFGDCLFQACSRLIGMGYGAACVLNSDSPTLPTAYLISAATALAPEGDRVVLGPAIDGGYYLLGVKVAHRRLFEDIAWSTEVVHQQTRERAAELGLPVVGLPSWFDVDDTSMLELLAREVLGGEPYRISGSRAPACDHTHAVLLRLIEQGTFVPRTLDPDPGAARAA